MMYLLVIVLVLFVVFLLFAKRKQPQQTPCEEKLSFFQFFGSTLSKLTRSSSSFLVSKFFTSPSAFLSITQDDTKEDWDALSQMYERVVGSNKLFGVLDKVVAQAKEQIIQNQKFELVSFSSEIGKALTEDGWGDYSSTFDIAKQELLLWQKLESQFSNKDIANAQKTLGEIEDFNSKLARYLTEKLK